MTKQAITALIIAVVLIGIGAFLLIRYFGGDSAPKQNQNQVPTPVATSTTQMEEPPKDDTKTVIGSSVENRDIVAYHYGTGTKEVLFVGGIHGGYAWNTTLVAYDLMDHLEKNPEVIPEGVKVTVIPVFNPDGLMKTVGTTTRFDAKDVPTAKDELIAGRFNAHTVDLNRNFDCDWKSAGVWQTRPVSGGKEVFSEPESKALKAYVEGRAIAGAVVWYSAAGGVFSSSCHNGISEDTKTLTNLYAKASGYPAYEEFDFYEITGDMVNWLARKNIPAISVLLSTHTDVEWNKNRAGIEAFLKHFEE